jgi:AcrR family transcriptional regulator
MSEPDAGLRARLIDVGAALVASEGSGAVSLREIARRAGVSHGAPRRYFPTHVDLLSAIARRGFSDLAARADQALSGRHASPRARLLALGRIYLEFAASDRGMFDLMFRHDLLESNRLGLREVSMPLFRMLTDLVAAARPRPDVTPDVTPAVAAGALWANLHGIAQLWEWGSLRLATGLDSTESLLRAALDAHVGPEQQAPTS